MANKKKKEAMKKAEDKVYSYMRMDKDGVFRRRTFKYSERTPEDIHYYIKQIGDAWDGAPIDSKVNFMLATFPLIRKFLKETDPELLMILLHDPEVEGLKVVN